MKRFLVAVIAAFTLTALSASADPQAGAPVVPGGNVLIDAQSDRNLTVELTIVGWDKNEVAVDQTYLSDPQAHISPSVVQQGATTKVSPLGKGIWRGYFFGLISAGGTIVRWTVHVPKAVALTANAGNSGVKVDGVQGPLTVHTSNGGVTVDGAGPVVDVETSNGGVDVTIASVGSQQPKIRIHTSNGGVNLRVPSGFHTRIHTQTWNGGTENPFAQANGPGSASIATSNGGINITTTE